MTDTNYTDEQLKIYFSTHEVAQQLGISDERVRFYSRGMRVKRNTHRNRKFTVEQIAQLNQIIDETAYKKWRKNYHIEHRKFIKAINL